MKTLIVALALTIGTATSAFANSDASDRGIPASLQNLEQGHSVSLSGDNNTYGFKASAVSADTTANTNR